MAEPTGLKPSRARLAAALSEPGDEVLVRAADLVEVLIDLGRLGDGCRTAERFLHDFAFADEQNADLLGLVHEFVARQMSLAGVAVGGRDAAVAA